MYDDRLLNQTFGGNGRVTLNPLFTPGLLGYLRKKGGATVPNEKDVKDYFNVWEKRQSTAAQIKYYTGKTWRTLADNILDSQRKKRNAAEKKLNDIIATKDKEIA